MFATSVSLCFVLLLTRAAAAENNLSTFEPSLHGRACDWVIRDVYGQRQRQITTLPTGCAGGRWAMTADRSRAVVFFDPNHGKSEYFAPSHAAALAEPSRPTELKLWEVDLGKGHIHTLPAPGYGRVVDVGFDDINRLWALTIQQETVLRDKRGLFFRVEGKRVSALDPSEGEPVVASSFLFSNGWQRVETKATSEDADYSQGVSVLAASHQLGPRSNAVLAEQVTFTRLSDATVLAQLAAFDPHLQSDERSYWSAVGSLPVVAWTIAGETEHPTGVIGLRIGDTWSRLDDGMNDADLVAIQARDQWLLVTTDNGSHPRLFNITTGVRLLTSDSSETTTWWPVEPAK